MSKRLYEQKSVAEMKSRN